MRWRAEQSDQDPVGAEDPGEGAEGSEEQAPEESSGEQAETDARYVLLCRGADGIGKTRIFQHLSERAREKEVAIYETQNYEVEGIPLKPFLHTIRRIMRDLDDKTTTGLAQQRIGSALIKRYRHALESLIPEAFSDASPSLESSVLNSKNWEDEKVRIFDGITQFLLEVSVHKPLLILVHDLHWADRTTVELLRYIGRNLQLRNEAILAEASGASGAEGEGVQDDLRSLATRAGTGGNKKGELDRTHGETDGGIVAQPSRLMLLANYRSFDDSSDGIAGALESLGDENFSFHGELRPLHRKEAKHFLEKSVEGVQVEGRQLEVTADAVDAVFELSEGFPSFQKELFRGVFLGESELSNWSGDTFRDYVNNAATAEQLGLPGNAPVRHRILVRRLQEYFAGQGPEGPGVEARVLQVLALARRPVRSDLISYVLASEEGGTSSAEGAFADAAGKLGCFAGSEGNEKVAEILEGLERYGIISLAGSEKYYFRLWDYTQVVESTIEPDVKKVIHQRIGDEYRRRLGSVNGEAVSTGEEAYEVYYHLSRGFEPFSSLEFGIAAGNRFQRTFALQKAGEIYEELINLLEGDDLLASRLKVLERLARVQVVLRDQDGALESLKRITQEEAGTLKPSVRTDLQLLEAQFLGAIDSGRALKILARAQKAISDEKSIESIRIHLEVTRCRLHKQDWKRTINYGLKGAELAQKVPDCVELAMFYQLVAQAFYRKGDYSHALDNFQRGLTVAEKLQDHSLTVGILDDLGRAYLERGNHFRAARYLYKALEMRQRHQDVSGLCRSYDQLGLVYRRDGDYHKTIENLSRSLSLKLRIGDFEGLNPTLGTLGDLCFRLGNYQVAIDYFQKEVENSRKVKEINADETEGLADAFVRLGRVYFEIGDLKQAERFCKQVLILATEFKLKSFEADGLLLDGNIKAYQLDWNVAEKSLKLAGDSYGRLGHRIRQACALLDLAEIKFHREAYDEALKLASRAQVIAEDVRALDLQVRILTVKGNVHRFLKGGNPQKAREQFGKALEMTQRLSDIKVLFDLYYALAKVHHTDREFSEAATFYGKADAILKRVGEQLEGDLQSRFFDDPRRKTFAEDFSRFSKESEARRPASESRERSSSHGDLHERPVGSDDYKSLLDSVLRINSTMNHLDFHQGCLGEAIEMTGAERGIIMVVRDREYLPTAVEGLGEDFSQHTEASSISQLAEDAIRRGRGSSTSGGESGSRSQSSPLKVLQDRSILVVPLRTGDRILGSIYLDRLNSLGPFTPRHKMLIEAYALQAAVVLQNRRNLDVAIREPVTGFYTPSYFLDRLREEYRFFNLHDKSFCLAGFYLPVLEDSLGESQGGLGEKLAREIASIAGEAQVCWGNPVLYLLFRETDLSLAEEYTSRVQERLQLLLAEEVPYEVLPIERRYQLGSDIYFDLRRKLLPEEGDHKTLTDLRQILAKDVKLKEAKKILERHIIENTLRKTNGNITHAARELGIHRPQLSNYLKKYGLSKERFESSAESPQITPMEN
ncbi:MAG: tetratricopeptide repeat protein [Planctomycetota bacterium]